MRLHVNPHCITIHIPENSTHYDPVSATLTKKFRKTVWVNETLINFPSDTEMKERKAFLTALYYTCAFDSKTHNAAFLERLIALHDKPIKMIKRGKPHTFPIVKPEQGIERDYRLLGASLYESLQSIRRKYLSLVKRYHPDALRGDLKESVTHRRTFQQIQEAYERIKASRKEQMAA